MNAVSVQDAEDFCLQDGGFLASLHSQGEQDVVDELVGSTAWIGYHDRDLEAGCTDHRHVGVGVAGVAALTFV